MRVGIGLGQDLGVLDVVFADHLDLVLLAHDELERFQRAVADIDAPHCLVLRHARLLCGSWLYRSESRALLLGLARDHLALGCSSRVPRPPPLDANPIMPKTLSLCQHFRLHDTECWHKHARQPTNSLELVEINSSGARTFKKTQFQGSVF